MEEIKGTLAHAVVMTAEHNKHPRESALLSLAWIEMSGGDYSTPSPQDLPDRFRAACDRAAVDMMAIEKENGTFLTEGEQKSVPLKIKKDNVEGFVLEMINAIGLDPAIGMQILGIIAYADGNLKKRLHLPTLAAHMSKEAARYGYAVDLQAMEDVPINITGAM